MHSLFSRCVALVAALVIGMTALAGADQALPAMSSDASGRHEVEGLKLPPPQEAVYDDSFVTLTAECKGQVRWLVLSTDLKVKYKISDASPNEIHIGIPPRRAVITVFAVAVVDGKLTDFARTDISVKEGAQPAPPKPDITMPLHLTIVEDPQHRTPATQAIIDSLELKKQLESRQCLRRVYVKNDPLLAAKGFTPLIEKHGLPLMVIQDHTGRALTIMRLPVTPAAVLAEVDRLLGGK